ncbi:HET-like protein [Alternaria alternata]|nr:HET-like protein [Alternaria alternata]
MAACLAIQRLKRRRENSYLYTNEASLYELAQCGCYYCRVLCEARPEYASLDEVYLELLDTALNATYFQEHHGSKRSLLREFFVLDSQDDPIIPTARHIPGNTGSRQSFKTINDWLDTCIKTHQGLCLASRSENATLPDRAIEVSLNMPRRIRLVDTKNREGRYACLSHCWGDKQPLRTTLKPYTLSIHQENIREEDLPKTFRDAITVSLSIGIQYIWIDSLCIIQDDEKDWQIQSAKMAAIYSNSTVTLAATEASNSEEGLFPVWELDLAPKNHYHPAGWRLLRGKLLGGDNPWTIAAFEFACLKLSKPNDIFPAISGIAKSFEEATGWTYVAGIWRETMPLGLLWRTFKKGHRPVRWRAPSFSWASITFDDLGVGRGIYHIGLQSPKVSAFIKEAKVSPISKDPMGQLKGGYIVLSGTLIQAIISHVGVDDRDWHQAFLTPLGREREDSYRFGTDFDLTQSGHVVEDGEAVFCLEIAQGEVESKEMIWYDGEFERIGLFTEIIPQDRVNRKPFEEASPEYAVERNALVKVI